MNYAKLVLAEPTDRVILLRIRPLQLFHVRQSRRLLQDRPKRPGSLEGPPRENPRFPRERIRYPIAPPPQDPVLRVHPRDTSGPLGPLGHREVGAPGIVEIGSHLARDRIPLARPVQLYVGALLHAPTEGSQVLNLEADVVEHPAPGSVELPVGRGKCQVRSRYVRSIEPTPHSRYDLEHLGVPLLGDGDVSLRHVVVNVMMLDRMLLVRSLEDLDQQSARRLDPGLGKRRPAVCHGHARSLPSGQGFVQVLDVEPHMFYDRPDGASGWRWPASIKMQMNHDIWEHHHFALPHCGGSPPHGDEHVLGRFHIGGVQMPVTHPYAEIGR